MGATRLGNASYILPLQLERPAASELTAYLYWLSEQLEVVVVDGSPSEVFNVHQQRWGHRLRHLPPAASLRTPNGKVGNVLTGMRHAGHERLIIADDDVRYDAAALVRMLDLLGTADVVRPQNYFDPLPWHGRWDTARTLLNRVIGGDWPGTLGVRRSVLQATGGYDGSVLFENLELVRTIRAAGGTEVVPLDLYVRRNPCAAEHFWRQRVRQAYDEWARPFHLTFFLSLLPAITAVVIFRQWRALLIGILAGVAIAEVGRGRAGGRQVFPFTCSLFAPLWLLERAMCSWFALGVRVLHGGVRYRGEILKRAATPMRELERRHAGTRQAVGWAPVEVYRFPSSPPPWAAPIPARAG